MIFKRNQIKIAVFILAVIILANGCSDGETKKASESISKTEGSASDYAVTFVELGSVKCVPCKMMQPIMKEIEEEYKGKVKVVFHDVWTEEGKPFAQKYKIKLIPTQVFLDKDGKEFHRHEGFYPKEQLEKVIKEQLEK